MSRTVTALYDTREEAQAACERLSSQIDVEGRAKIMDSSCLNDDDGQSEFRNIAISPEDRDAYGESLKRGGFMLCAEVDEDEDADKIVSILEQTSSVDLDQRQDSWRTEGSAVRSDNLTGSSTANGREDVVQEERIPVIEEQLRVGKRVEQRGGARVRTYVEETPVSDQVTLREEHVSVERRPVDETVSPRDLESSALLQDREVEMHETAEHAVIGKEARVKEELVIQKTASERTEDIQDTVRETKVEVDDRLDETNK